MNTYKATSPRGEAEFGVDVFEQEFSVTDEQDWLSAGHLVIVPRTYRVLSNNYSAGEQNALVELALLKENEQALITGGHIERVDKPKAKKRTAEPPSS